VTDVCDRQTDGQTDRLAHSNAALHHVARPRYNNDDDDDDDDDDA